MVHSIDKASKGIWKCYIGSIPILGVRVVQVHISDAAGSFPDMQELRYSLLKQLKCLRWLAILQFDGNVMTN